MATTTRTLIARPTLADVTALEDCLAALPPDRRACVERGIAAVYGEDFREAGREEGHEIGYAEGEEAGRYEVENGDLLEAQEDLRAAEARIQDLQEERNALEDTVRDLEAQVALLETRWREALAAAE